MSKAFLGGFEGSLVLVLSGFVCSDLVFCLFFYFFGFACLMVWFFVCVAACFCFRNCGKYQSFY